MKSKGILFRGEMVRAILDNRKSMTRRICNPQPTWPRRNNIGWLGWDDGHGYKMRQPYKPGDILYVKETWDETYNPTTGYAYKASCNEDALHLFKWHSPLFMPRSAARIWLMVKDVRCEKLQEITPHDAWLEGCRIGNSFPWEDHIPDLQQMCRDIAFLGVWNNINDKNGYHWSANPWVWVITFERMEQGVQHGQV